MKKVGEIMQELGFNKESPEATKEAFIRHLIKASTGVEVAPRKVVTTEDQLSFAFDEAFQKGESA